MNLKLYGTRGTIGVGGNQVAKYGGMTTCLRVHSDCLPPGMWLVVDAGNGVIPLARDGIAAGVKEVKFLFSHYHHDHTIGLPICGWTFMKDIAMSLTGPIDKGIGPKQILQGLMAPPNFPIAYAQVASHIEFKGIENPIGMVIAIHPVGGMKLFKLDELERAENQSTPQLPFPGKGRHNIRECLIIRMQRTNHPDYTVSYRFEERPTGKVFVFLTDHENQFETPMGLWKHLWDADLIIADCQYSERVYPSRAGFGHGTPSHCIKIAKAAGAKRLGLTHHDPMSTDDDVDAILLEAQDYARQMEFAGDVFACADYQEIEL